MTITIGYSDFIKLFHVEDTREFVPGLKVCTDGVYVKKPDECVLRAGGNELSVLTEHPTGDLSAPALALPCSVEEVEQFVNFYGLHGYVDAFVLLKLLKKRAFEQAQIKAQEEGAYHWPIVAGLHALKHRWQAAHDRESNDSKKVVWRAVLDGLTTVFPDPSIVDGSQPIDDQKKPAKLRSDREENLLRVIAAFRGLKIGRGNELPSNTSELARYLGGQARDWGWDSPDEKTIADTILAPASKIPRVKKTPILESPQA